MKRKIKSLDEVDEHLRSLYTKQGDIYVLTLEDDDDGDDEKDTKGESLKVKVNRFRDDLRKQGLEKKEIEEKLKAFEGLDPTKVADLLKTQTMIDQNEELRLLKEGKGEELKTRWTKAQSEAHQRELNTLKTQLVALQNERQGNRDRLKKLTFNQQIAKAVEEVGVVKPGALDTIVLMAQQQFDLDDTGDNIVPLEEFEADENGKPYTLNSFIKELATTKQPYLFESATGSGAPGNRNGARSQKNQNIRVLQPDSEGVLQAGRGDLEALAGGKATVAGMQ